MKNNRISTAIGLLFVLLAFTASGQSKLNVSGVEEITFSTGEFEITGNIYLPAGGAGNGLVVWVHGDGPDLRRNRFPGNAFFNVFLDNGIAYFRYDKPGHGDSKGEFTDNGLFDERAAIVGAAVDALKRHPSVDSSRIGLVGSSQAGYVMPLVTEKRTDIAFMIGLSLPAIEGNKQWAYLLKQQMLCEGYSEKEAETFRSTFLELLQSDSHEDFLNTLEYFREHPIDIPSLHGYDRDLASKLETWWPLDWVSAQDFNPMGIIRETKIPVLSIYGANDAQVDPVQGAGAYRTSLESAGNGFFEVTVIEHADHNMSVSKTGCLKEQQERQGFEMAPELPVIVTAWLERLAVQLSKAEN